MKQSLEPLALGFDDSRIRKPSIVSHESVIAAHNSDQIRMLTLFMQYLAVLYLSKIAMLATVCDAMLPYIARED